MKSPDPTRRFSDRVTDYAKYRPTYPTALIETMFESVGQTDQVIVTDIGSGTGILTKLLLDHGAVVYAIEPNEPMRMQAERDLTNHERFRSIDGRADQTGLESAISDVTCCAQSFHWFTNRKAATELRRITKPMGTIWLIWNVRKVEFNSFAREYAEIVDRYSPEYKRVRHENVTRETIKELFDRTSMEQLEFDNPQRMDWESLWGRLRSSSYAPGPEDEFFDPLRRDLEVLYDMYKEAGIVEMPVTTKVYKISN